MVVFFFVTFSDIIFFLYILIFYLIKNLYIYCNNYIQRYGNMKSAELKEQNYQFKINLI